MSEAASGSLMVRFAGSRSDHVERLFSRLAANYGDLFLKRWGGVDLDDVRAEWARQLDGVPGYRVGYALDNLPPFPPTLPEFKALCAAAPLQSVPLPAPVATLPRESERVLSLEERKARLETMKALVAKWKIVT